MKRNLNARNHGLGNRDIARALSNAYKVSGNGMNSNHITKTAFKVFSNYCKAENVKDLRKLTHEHVKAYAEHLLEKHENGDLSVSTIHNYLSPINRALEVAKLSNSHTVHAVRDAGFPSRSGISQYDKSISAELHQSVKNDVSERLAVQIELQRELGLRFKESCLIDAKATLSHAMKNGKIKIEDGTKGGREREFSITSAQQITVLEKAAEIQKTDRSLVPASMSWNDYRNECYRATNKHNHKFHGERHHFANERYSVLVGAQSPVRAGVTHCEHIEYLALQLDISKSEAREIDQRARMQVSVELGHGRISITNSYLG